MASQRSRFPCELHEHILRHVRRVMGVAAHLPQRGSIHKVDVPAHQFAERVFRSVGGVTTEQLVVVQHGGFIY
jgi:hypothetical protein